MTNKRKINETSIEMIINIINGAVKSINRN